MGKIRAFLFIIVDHTVETPTLFFSIITLNMLQLIVGSCDGRVAVYEAQRGALIRNIEPQLPVDRRDLIAAAPSPSGQVRNTFIITNLFCLFHA